MEKHVQAPTKESIDRLHVVNQIRDSLKENSKALADAGFTQVLLFGSVENGSAGENSDTDLCFVHNPVDDEDFTEYTNKVKQMESVVALALSKSGKEVTFRGSKSGDRDVIHVSMQPIGEETGVDGKPYYAAESFPLWEAPAQINSRVFRSERNNT